MSAITSRLAVKYFAWLTGQSTEPKLELGGEEGKLDIVPEHKRPSLRGWQAFLTACSQYKSDKSLALREMQAVVTVYHQMPVHHRLPLVPYYLLAMLALNEHQHSPSRQQEAETALRDYLTPRQGRLPRSFLDTLSRLNVPSGSLL
jgi:hypothetical protein